MGLVGRRQTCRHGQSDIEVLKLIWTGCATRASKPYSCILRGHFGRKRYPVSGSFMKCRSTYTYIFAYYLPLILCGCGSDEMKCGASLLNLYQSSVWSNNNYRLHNSCLINFFSSSAIVSQIWNEGEAWDS